MYNEDYTHPLTLLTQCCRQSPSTKILPLNVSNCSTFIDSAVTYATENVVDVCLENIACLAHGGVS